MGVSRLVALGVAAVAVTGSTPAWAWDATDFLGGQGVQVVASDVLAGSCRLENMSTPLDDGSGGGIPFEVQGAGTAAGADVAATDVGCRIWQGSTLRYSKFSGYRQGFANAFTDTFVETVLSPLETCVQVAALTTPSGHVNATQWLHADGSACSHQ